MTALTSGDAAKLITQQGESAGVVIYTAADACVAICPTDPSIVTSVVDQAPSERVRACVHPLEYEGHEKCVQSVADVLQNLALSAPEQGTPSTDMNQPMQLLQPPLAAETRGKVSSALPLGVSVIDALAPVAHGQSMLLVHNEEQHAHCRSVIATATKTAANADVKCFAVMHSASADEATSLPGVHTLKLEHTASVEAELLMVCRAIAYAEAARDAGENALVAIDDVSCIHRLWELIKPEKVLDKGATLQQNAEEASDSEKPSLIETDEGVLMQAETAERRSFAASILQRAGQLSDGSGGGSVTLLVGVPYTASSRGHERMQQVVQQRMPLSESHPNLSDEQRRKLQEALHDEAVSSESQAHEQTKASSTTQLAWQDALEMMSLSDGQVVLHPDAVNEEIVADVGATFSRLGSEAASPALRMFASNTTRLQMVQAEDSMQESYWLQQANILFSQPLSERRPIEWTALAALALKHGLSVSRSDLSNALLTAAHEAPDALNRVTTCTELEEGDEEQLLQMITS